MNLYQFNNNAATNYIDITGKNPILIPVAIGVGLLAGCSDKADPSKSEDDFVLKPAESFIDTTLTNREHKLYVPKCMIAVFIGHNRDVPQGTVQPFYDVPDDFGNENKACSGNMTIACGNLGGDEDTDTNPCPSTIPGSPTPIDGTTIDLIQVERKLKEAEANAKWYAQFLCNRRCCKCKTVTVVFHYFSNVGKFTKNTQKSYVISCGN